MAAHRFVVRPVGETDELGAYHTLEDARLWAKRLAFANTSDVEIVDVVEDRVVEGRKNQTEITLDDGRTAAWRAGDPAVRAELQEQADRFECAIVVFASDGAELGRLEHR